MKVKIKLKIKLIIFLVLFIKLAISQELKLSTAYGFAVGKTNNSKNNFLAQNNSILIEINIGFRTALIAGFNYNKLSFSNTSSIETVYVKNKFLMLPVGVKKYFRISKNSTLFIELSLYANKHLAVEKEVFINGTNSFYSNKNLGYSFGTYINWGLKTVIGSNWYFDIGLAQQKDYLFSYEKDKDKLETERNLLCFSFYKRLGK